jgi:hypothetical protein
MDAACGLAAARWLMLSYLVMRCRLSLLLGYLGVDMMVEIERAMGDGTGIIRRVNNMHATKLKLALGLYHH